jgi:RuvB-like protein 1
MKHREPAYRGGRLVEPGTSAAAPMPHQVEGIAIDAESLAYVGEVGEQTSLRHAVQLLTPAATLARTNGRDAVSRGDLEEAHELFHDAKYTARLLAEQAEYFIT